MLDALIADLGSIDWSNLSAVTTTTDKLLSALDTDRPHLRRTVENAVADPHLRTLCEHYDILDKIVVHDDPTGWRLRLHVFLPGYFDRPHNHRWTYASRILNGSYTHTMYGTDETVGEHVDPADLTARLIRVEGPGDTYTLHHTMIHSVVAEPTTVTLVARGPVVKDRFLVTDRHTGRAWWQYGADRENSADQEAKRMTAGQAEACLRLLAEEGIWRK